MRSAIEVYLLEQTERLLFLSLKEEKLEHPKLEEIRDIEIPIFTRKIPQLGSVEHAGIRSSEIAGAMLFILGIDGDFRYREQYLRFIHSFTDSPVHWAKELIMTAYKNNNLLESLLYTRGYLNVFGEEEDFLFNYGALCEEYAAGLEEEEKKAAFQEEAQRYLYPFIGKKIEQALQLIEGEEYQKAETLLMQVLQKSKEDFDANFYMGYLKRLQQNYEKALDFYEIAYGLKNDLPRLINEMGLCFSFLGDFEQALELFLYANSLDPSSTEILCNISMIFLNMNQIDEARSYAQKALELHPEDEVAAACILEIRKYEE